MVRIHSEIGRLRRVLTKQTVSALRRINPDEWQKCLIDEPIDQAGATNEHMAFSQVLKSWGVEVLDSRALFHNLLVSANGEADEMTARVVKNLVVHRPLTEKDWLSIPADERTDWLISGYHAGLGQTHLPIANLMFSRDAAAVIGECVYVLKQKEPVRQPENVIIDLVVDCHPLFVGVKMMSFHATEWPSEGGDFLPLSPDVVIIGCGHRTHPKAVELIAEQLFHEGFGHVFRLNMQSERRMMHADTVVTQISQNECLVYPPAILQTSSGLTSVDWLYCQNGLVKVEQVDSLLGGLAEVGIHLDPIKCGGNDPSVQDDEQLWDGANSFAVAPGVIFLYDYCKATIRELVERGYQPIPVQEAPKELPTSKTVVLLPSEHLAKGRGGPHCLTMPLLRD